MGFRPSLAPVFAVPAILVVATLAARPAIAQTSQAEIRGTVVDESGAALPGATVTATHVDTGAVRTTVTSETGVFLMPAMPLGPYRVQAELTGFTSMIQQNFRLEVGQSAVLTFTLKLATVQETVTVTGESPLVDTRSSELAGRV